MRSRDRANRATVLLEKTRVLLRLLGGRMRAALLRLRGARVGRKVTIGRRFHVSRPWCLQLGERVVIEDDVYLKIDKDHSHVKIGDYAFVGRGSEFDVIEHVSIGAHTLIAPGVFVTDHNHGVDTAARMNTQPCLAQAVAIGKDTWIGAKATILPGATVGDGAIVGANAVVTRDVPPNVIVAGSPARPIGSRGSKQ